MSKKRILFMAGASYVSGAELTNFNLIRDLHSKGYPLFVVVNGWNDGDFIKRLSEINVSYREIKLGFIYLSKPLWTLDTLVHLPKALFQLSKILKEFKPDWVFHCSYRTLFIGLPLFKKYRNVYREHDEPEINQRTERIYKYINSNVKALVCPSVAIKEILIRLSIPTEKISVIPSPLDPELIIQGKKNVSAKNPPVRIGIVGQIIPRKGLPVLFDSIRNVKGSFIIHIYGNGDDDYKESLMSSLEGDLIDKIEWRGFVKNREEIYSNLDIVVFPSLSESFGRVIIEAGAFGVPIIVSDIPCFKEIVQHGRTGLIFNLDEIETLSMHLNTLIEDSELRKRLGIAAQEYVSKNFNSMLCTQKFEQIINK